jgi:hypothetical protein
MNIKTKFSIHGHLNIKTKFSIHGHMNIKTKFSLLYLHILGLCCNSYWRYQRWWGKTRFKTAFPRTLRCVFSQSVKKLGLIRTMAYFFPSRDSLFILYLRPIRSKRECATCIWNYIMFTDAWQLERIRRKFVALCQDHLFTSDQVTYYLWVFSHSCKASYPAQQKTLFWWSIFIAVHSYLQCCLSVLDTITIRVFPRNFRNSTCYFYFQELSIC